MRLIMWITLFVLAAVVTAAAWALIFNEPQAPPELRSVTRALDATDMSSLPEAQTLVARDGTHLVYRAYQGQGDTTAILIHGATLTSASMHVVAQALQARGATAYALGMRGHEGGGRIGDVDYIGQLSDDIEDFVKTLPPKQAGAQRALIGFSAGGGLALAIAGDGRGRAFDRFVLLAPALPAGVAPIWRPDFGGFVKVAWPRIYVLIALNQLGLTQLNYLHTSAFAVGENARIRAYSARMAASFGARARYLDDLGTAPGPVSVIIGVADELLLADQYEPTLRPARPDLDLTVLPGLNHMDIIIRPEAVALIADKAVAP
jgi:alpha-beta hydrolase superfamily lysophospholipase